MHFPALSSLPHRFVLREPHLSMDVGRAEALERLRPHHDASIQDLGFGREAFRSAEQVHGNDVTLVQSDSPGHALGSDGLITQTPGLLLGIYVADCCAVYLHDPRTRSIGLLHAGKKGTELGILPRAIDQMRAAFGTQPRDLIVQLSPCIRPPHYEIDFAAQLRQQAYDADIPREQVHDDRQSTAIDLQRFYSYRIEKGRTGRMLALLGLQVAPG